MYYTVYYIGLHLSSLLLSSTSVTFLNESFNHVEIHCFAFVLLHKCHIYIHFLLYFLFDLFLLADMPTHSLQHQITSDAISSTILWPEYLAQVSASSLNLPSTLSPHSGDGNETSCVLSSLLVQSLPFVLHKFPSNFYFLHFGRQYLCTNAYISPPREECTPHLSHFIIFYIEPFLSLDTRHVSSSVRPYIGTAVLSAKCLCRHVYCVVV